MDREDRTWLRIRLDELGMTTAEAAAVCGVSVATMGIVVGGSPTLPQLAIKIGKGLRLTREEVKPLGKPLDARLWGRDGLPKPPKVDVDPEWYKALPQKYRDSADSVPEINGYIDVKAVLNRLMAMGKDIDAISGALGGYTMRKVNERSQAARRRCIADIAKVLGCQPQDIRTSIKPRDTKVIRFLVDCGAVQDLMCKPGNSTAELTERLFSGGEKGTQMSRLMSDIRAGEAMTVDRAARLAEALGAEVGEIGQRVIRIF